MPVATWEQTDALLVHLGSMFNVELRKVVVATTYEIIDDDTYLYGRNAHVSIDGFPVSGLENWTKSLSSTPPASNSQLRLVTNRSWLQQGRRGGQSDWHGVTADDVLRHHGLGQVTAFEMIALAHAIVRRYQSVPEGFGEISISNGHGLRFWVRPDPFQLNLIAPCGDRLPHDNANILVGHTIILPTSVPGRGPGRSTI